MDKNQEQELSYKIQFSNSVCLVSFSGFLIKKNVKVLGEVSREVLEKDGIKFCIFDYSKLQEIGKYIDRDLVQFQVNLRSKEIEARHCGLPALTKREFINVGTMKKGEIRETSSEALKEIARLSNYRG